MVFGGEVWGGEEVDGRGTWKVGDGFLGAGGREVGVGSKKILIPKVPPIEAPGNPYFSRFQRG